jgi:thiamine kinase-like enzyme
MLDRDQHQQEVRGFLQKHFPGRDWDFSLPPGSGNETYFARRLDQACFVKLGVQMARYHAMASIGLTPPLLASGSLEDGTSILVQPFLEGRRPSQADYRLHLEQIAAAIERMHHDPAVKASLPPVPSDLYLDLASAALTSLQERWLCYREQVPEVADFVDESLAALARQVQSFAGAGLVASHNDICNYNWLIASDGRIYLIDLDSMSLDDPAFDIGATLWWYYPPELRPRFLEITGHAKDEQFQARMRVRMAMHCLNITLPRANSFDIFERDSFAEWLTDFRAVMANEENPQGYEG